MSSGLSCSDSSGFGPAAAPGCGPTGQPFETSKPAGFTPAPSSSYPDYSQTGYPDGRPPAGSPTFVEGPRPTRPPVPTTFRPSIPSPVATQLPNEPNIISQPNRHSTSTPFEGYPSGEPPTPTQPPYRPNPISQTGYQRPSQPLGPSDASSPPFHPSRPSQSPFQPQGSGQGSSFSTPATTPSPFVGSLSPFEESQGPSGNIAGIGPVGSGYGTSPSGPGESNEPTIGTDGQHSSGSPFGPSVGQPENQVTNQPNAPSPSGPSSGPVSSGAPDSPDDNSITEHPDEILQGSHSPDKKPYPVYVIPFPVNIVPSPSSCPCYLVTPGNGTSSSSPNQSPPSPPIYNGQVQHGQPYGIIGYIPVVFYPYCPGNETNHEAIQTMFPSAVSAPYPCNQCVQPQPPAQTQEQYFGRRTNYRPRGQARSPVYQLDNAQNSFQQVMSQANIDMSGIARAPHRRKVVYGRRIRSRKVQREENN